MDEGVVTRTKIENIWAYAADDASIAFAEAVVYETALTICRAWLLAPLRPLSNTIARDAIGLTVSADVVSALLRAALRAARLKALPLLTKDEYYPFLVAYTIDDSDEIDRQLDAATALLLAHGSLRPDDLPEPSTPREFRAWRTNLLGYLEFDGRGRIVNGELQAWRG